MPRIPKWLADSMMKVFGSQVYFSRVVRIEYFDESLKLIRFQSDGLKNVKCWPGMVVEFRVSDTEFRHYTACDWNTDEGFIDILVFLHGEGPGSKFMDDLAPLDHVPLIKPGGSFYLDFTNLEIVFLGDETAIGLFLAFQECRLPKTYLSGAVECDNDYLPFLTGLNLQGVKRVAGDDGAALLKWAEETPLSTENCKYYLVGNADVNKLMRQKLKSIGVADKMIKEKAHWAKGREGL